MKVSDAIFDRRSIRHFADKEVPFERIMDCIEAASWAPSAGNLQNVRFVIVRDEKKRQMVTDACLEQQWMMQAPCHVVICSDPTDIVKIFPEQGAKYAQQTAAAAAQNFCLMATELKLGTCWVSAFDDFALARDLGVPSHVHPEVVIALGYPLESPKSSRIAVDLITFFESWGARVGKRKGIVESATHSIQKKLKSLNKKGMLP